MLVLVEVEHGHVTRVDSATGMAPDGNSPAPVRPGAGVTHPRTPSQTPWGIVTGPSRRSGAYSCTPPVHHEVEPENQ